MKSFTLKDVKYTLKNKLPSRIEFKSTKPLFLFIKIGNNTYINYCYNIRFSKKNNRIYFLASKYIIIDNDFNYEEVDADYLFYVIRDNIYHVSSDYSEINRMLQSMNKNKGLL